MVQEAREDGMLIDATYGRRTKSVIITDSDHIILSAIQTENIVTRLTKEEEISEGDFDE